MDEPIVKKVKTEPKAKKIIRANLHQQIFWPEGGIGTDNHLALTKQIGLKMTEDAFDNLILERNGSTFKVKAANVIGILYE